MDLMQYDIEDSRMMIDIPGSQDESSQDTPDEEIVSLSLPGIEKYLAAYPAIYTQMLKSHDTCEDGEHNLLLLVSLASTHPHLVDLQPVRLNIYSREKTTGPLLAELVTLSRHKILSTQVTCLADIDSLVHKLTTGFHYYHGFDETCMKMMDIQLSNIIDLQSLLIQSYNNKICIRSRACTSVVNRDAAEESQDQEESVQTEYICQACLELRGELLRSVDEADEARYKVEAEEGDSDWPLNLTEESSLKDISHDKLRLEIEVKPPESDAPSHAMDKNPQTAKPKKRSKQKVRSAKRGKMCDICQQTFARLKDLDQHLIDNPDSSCKENADFAPNITLNLDGNHECEICGKWFAKKVALKQHKETHNNTKGYLCIACGTAFKSQSHLINHRKRVHLRLKFHGCSECGKEFYSKKEYDEHVRTHSGDKPFQCTQCGKFFSRSAHLKRHTDSIHGLKPDKDTEEKGRIEDINETSQMQSKKPSSKKKGYKTLKALLMKPDLATVSATSTTT
uniref:Putative zinc finger protein 25 n=1 Tax=Acartia pacifica TaxID=335913 RepID=A0A0U2VC55_ACAPC|nr:putative zinc finger protein 25 [Acartia pacifica]